MAETKQGSFEKTYHHIDAPTHTDEIWGKEHKRRKLTNPNDPNYKDVRLEDIFRTPSLAALAKNNYPFEIKRKLDGENIRIFWNGEQALWNGKTNNFVTNHEFTDYMNSTFLEEMFEEKFGRDTEVYLFGEKMGKKSQKNELGLDRDEFILYDVNINGYWLDSDNIKDIAKFFHIKTCYDFMDGVKANLAPQSITEIIQQVAHPGVYFRDPNTQKVWEGVVVTPVQGLKDKGGNRIIAKIKYKDYGES